MLANYGSNWFDRRRQEPTWPSIVASLAITFGLFAAAFTAMRTVGVLRSRAEHDAPEVVRLQPPPEPPKPRPVAKTASPAPAAPATTPSAIDVAPPTATTNAPVTARPPSPAPAETASTARVKTTEPTVGATPVIPLGPIRLPSGLSDTAMSLRGGAPNTGAAVSNADRAPNTARTRDSIAKAKMNAATYSAWMAHQATGKEKQEMEASQRAGVALATRSTTAGSREVHISQGEGRNGEGAVGGAGGSPTSIGVPLFSSGPSKAQRRVNEKLDAEYQSRLRRLQDLIIARKDSARLDSLRRDSLARLKRP